MPETPIRLRLPAPNYNIYTTNYNIYTTNYNIYTTNYNLLFFWILA